MHGPATIHKHVLQRSSVELQNIFVAIKISTIYYTANTCNIDIAIYEKRKDQQHVGLSVDIYGDSVLEMLECCRSYRRLVAASRGNTTDLCSKNYMKSSK